MEKHELHEHLTGDDHSDDDAKEEWKIFKIPVRLMIVAIFGVGVVMSLVGVGLCVWAYYSSHSNLDLRTAAIIGITVTCVGVVTFAFAVCFMMMQKIGRNLWAFVLLAFLICACIGMAAFTAYSYFVVGGFLCNLDAAAAANLKGVAKNDALETQRYLCFKPQGFVAVGFAGFSFFALIVLAFVKVKYDWFFPHPQY